MISASVSNGNLLIATTQGIPNRFCIFSTCFNKFGSPFSNATKSSFPNSVLASPPCIFNALTVATTTTALGFKPANLHFISKNFSAPKSAPKPASVTT